MMNLCYPVLNGAAGHTYSVQPGLGYMADSYFNIRKMVHSGSDYNATSGGDTDFGDPVYCIADGVVRDAGTYRGWGKDALIHHPILEDKTNLYFESMYAHMSRILVVPNQIVRFGDIIGFIGKGWLAEYLAHLHFELRIKKISPPDWPSSLYPLRARAEAYCRATRIDSEIYFRQKGALRTLAEVNKVRASLKLPPVSGYKAA